MMKVLSALIAVAALLGGVQPHRIAEGAENLGRVAVRFDPVFRMPLDADSKGAGSLDRNRFDRAVSGNSFDLELRSQPVDRLAMQGVDLDVAGTEHAGQAAAWLDRNGLVDGEAFVLLVAHLRAVVERTLALLDLGAQRAA